MCLKKIFKRPGFFILTTLITIILCYAVSLFLFRGYTATAKIAVRSDTRETAQSAAENMRLINDRRLRTAAAAIKNHKIMEKVAEELNLKETFGAGDAAARLLAAVKTKPLAGTDIIEISVSSYKPELATQIANTICKVVIVDSEKERFSFEKDILSWLSKEASRLREDVEATAKRLREYRKQSGIMDIKTDYEATKQRIKELQINLAAVHAAAQEAEASYENLKNSLAQGAKPQELIVVQNDDSYKELESEHAVIESEIVELSKKYHPDHPAIVEKNARLKTAEELMASRANAVIDDIKENYSIFAEREKELEKISKEENEKLEKLEEGLDEYKSLLNLLKEKENVYRAFIKKTEEGFGSGLKTQQISLLEQAYLPTRTDMPPVAFIIFCGVVLGLIATILYNSLSKNGGEVLTEKKIETTAKAKEKGMYIERVRHEEDKK